MIEPDPIFLDHSATTPLLPEVLDAMLPYLRRHFGNPSSDNVYGARARGAVARARQQVVALGCDDDEVVFTSGGTQANNLAIRGVAEAHHRRRTVVSTVIEHPATAGKTSFEQIACPAPCCVRTISWRGLQSGRGARERDYNKRERLRKKPSTAGPTSRGPPHD
jgi:Aminotransferase class-V